jgi:hypothetical protein
MRIGSILTRLAPIGVVCGVAWLCAWASRSPLENRRFPEPGPTPADVAAPIRELDTLMVRRWADAGLTPASPANEMQVLRRLALALVGATPSLEEIRDFEADTRPDRLTHWTRRFLGDDRSAEYLSERLARVFVGSEGGQFVTYRRDRFKEWLAEQLKAGTPYDDMVRTMISADGLSTGEPPVNFVAATLVESVIDYNKLTGRTVRAFLGQRIDCAQCHDHPFDDWKQHDFEGLAAFYGQTKQTITGIEDRLMDDGKPVEYSVEDRKTLKQRTVEPGVPFLETNVPAEGTRRERLARWVTSPGNRRFDRAIVNRVWGLLFGRPYHDPVDDLPDPDQPIPVLDILAKDFQQNGRDLRRLMLAITGSRAFRLDSQLTDELPEDRLILAEQEWAVFPLIRLRPEQMIRSMRQGASFQTHDHQTHLLLRLPRYFQEFDFIREYGDLGDNELQDRGGTIPQRLLIMNGGLANENLKASPFTASGRLAALGVGDDKRIETAFLIAFTRRPTPEEMRHFQQRLADEKETNDRGAAIEDMLWALFNSTEYSWNH